MVSGGNDVDPQRYNQPVRDCGRLIPVRDEQDILLVKAAMTRKIPMLGICRGLQIMAVAMGGDMYQDVQKEAEKGLHELTMFPRNAVSHFVLFPEDSPLRSIFDAEEIGVNSLHHQAVHRLPANGKEAAVSPDGVIEAAVFSGGHSFFLGVQWHPEMMYDSEQQAKLFSAFVSACRKE